MAQKKKIVRGEAAQRYKAKQRIVTLLMLITLAAVAVPATTALFAIGMVPTMVAVIVERKHRDLAIFTVGPLNAVGTIPGIFDLWEMGHRVNNVPHILADSTDLLYILGSSAVGWACYNGFPPMIEAMLTYRGQRTLRRCRDTQERLRGEWGDTVADRANLAQSLMKKKSPKR